MTQFEVAAVVSRPRAALGTVTLLRTDEEGVWLLALEGEHDRSTTRLLAEQTRRVWPPGTRVLVDLSDVEFIDSSVITWLLRTRRALAATGHQPLRIIEGSPDSAAARMLSLLSGGLRTSLGCYSTLADASTGGDGGASPSVGPG